MLYTHTSTQIYQNPPKNDFKKSRHLPAESANNLFLDSTRVFTSFNFIVGTKVSLFVLYVDKYRRFPKILTPQLFGTVKGIDCYLL